MTSDNSLSHCWTILWTCVLPLLKVFGSYVLLLHSIMPIQNAYLTGFLKNWNSCAAQGYLALLPFISAEQVQWGQEKALNQNTTHMISCFYFFVPVVPQGIKTLLLQKCCLHRCRAAFYFYINKEIQLSWQWQQCSQTWVKWTNHRLLTVIFF